MAKFDLLVYYLLCQNFGYSVSGVLFDLEAFLQVL